MRITRLSLTNFRNYAKQELELPAGVSFIYGENAQGKSNLLEAIFLLATTRSERSQTDGELINWAALEDTQPVARVEAEVERSDGPLKLEVIVVGRPRGPDAVERVPASKRLRVNGVAKRQADMVGQLMAVLFTTEDMDLVSGAPAGRRRYMDVMLSQLERGYARSLSRYNKLVSQRNALLKRIQERDAEPDELEYWDSEIASDGAAITRSRGTATVAVGRLAADAHAELSGGDETLAIEYQPRLEGWDGDRAAAASEDELREALLEKLERARSRDIAAGITLSGPHRDDLSITLNGVAAGAFASRGQQRTVALAVRLAEARYMAACRGELPVVLLDDVLSELDEHRQRAVLGSLGGWDQLLITSAEPERSASEVPGVAAVFRVREGTIERVEPAHH
jgi:DNA replication and repair protein RecF